MRQLFIISQENFEKRIPKLIQIFGESGAIKIMRFFPQVVEIPQEQFEKQIENRINTLQKLVVGAKAVNLVQAVPKILMIGDYQFEQLIKFIKIGLEVYPLNLEDGQGTTTVFKKFIEQFFWIWRE
eukprot:EC095858.1.p2 GENE.EC095858.1~~EC095858.1.p2  ORF type:complete len:126 (+),score=2.24 EC095858.1:59-436(+)